MTESEQIIDGARPEIPKRENRPHALADAFSARIQRQGDREPELTGEMLGLETQDWDRLVDESLTEKRRNSDYVVTSADIDSAAEVLSLCSVEQLEEYFKGLGQRYPEFRDFMTIRTEAAAEWMRIIRIRGMRMKDLHTFRGKLAEILTEDPKFRWSNLIAYITRNVRSSSEYQAVLESQPGSAVSRLTLIARAAG